MAFAGPVPDERFALDLAILRYRRRETESAYRAAQRPRNLRQVRLGLAAAIVLNLPWAALDLASQGDWQAGVVLVRVLGITAIFVGLLALTFRAGWERNWPALALAGLAIYSVFFLWSSLVSATPEPALPFTGFTLVVLAGYLLFPFYFAHGVFANLLVTVGYLAVVIGGGVLSGFAAAVVAAQLVFVNAVGGYSLYRHDWYRRRDWENLQALEAQRARYRDLLVRILPQAIADRLTAGEAEIAETHDGATVLFADIDGFTDGAAACAPEATVALLNRLFRRFDALAAAHGLEKIKTIGDGYMAAAGVPQPLDDHAARAADLALAMQAAAAGECWPDGRPVSVRIGLHSGPLVAGVIGDSRFLYDLWGDTVNTASRMETLARPGTVQATAAVRDALADRYRFEALGEVAVKGKGRLSTWRLLGPLSAVPAGAVDAAADRR